MQTNSPDTYTVTCSPSLMTTEELDRMIDLARVKLSGHPLSQPAAYSWYDSLVQEKHFRKAAR